MACAKAICSGLVPIPNMDDSNIEKLFLASKSFSAGGVVVAATINEGPADLFDAVSLINPFLNVSATMSMNEDPSHFLTIHEWDEFGDPISDKKAHDVITKYCPFLNVGTKQRLYPPMLIISTLDDENVPFHHGVCYAEKVRKAMKHVTDTKNGTADNGHMLLHIEHEGGHNLHGKTLDVSTMENCFLLGHLFKYITSNNQ